MQNQILLKLIHSLIHHFETVPNSKKLQTTTEMWLLKDFKIQIALITLWKKVELTQFEQFHLFPQCFPKAFFLLCVKMSIYGGKGQFNPFPHNDTFVKGSKPFENTVGKGEIARNEQFLLFPQCFLLFWKTFFHFRQIWNCRLQTLSVWKSLKFVVW